VNGKSYRQFRVHHANACCVLLACACLPRQSYANVVRRTAMAAPRKSDTPPPRFTLRDGQRALPVLQGGADCVVALRALGEDTRLRIVGLLLQSPLDVGEIAARLGVSHYNVSKHLRILREAGLLDVEKDGRVRRYALLDDIRRRAAAGSVLDLGCCSFQFEKPHPTVRVRGRRRRPVT